MKDITRRQFGKAAGAAAALAGVSLPKLANGEPKTDDLKFPESFVWGCATAAYQIEGAVNEDGRKPSIWDVFSHTPGKVHNGDTGDVADDSYHLYKEDTRLLKRLGTGGYRLSISWPRIFPDGTGKPNAAGLDHYKRVIDELLANGITPYVTLFHWDLPAALKDGWQSRDTAKAYAEYAGYMAGQLADRVHHFMTINEFDSFTNLGYKTGQFAPGLKLPAARGEPSAPQRRSCARAWRHSDSRQRARSAGGAGGEPDGVCAGDRGRDAHRGGAARDARRECVVSDRSARGQIYGRLSGARGCECPASRSGRYECDREPARLSRAERVRAVLRARG